jgi:hypothetical protein
MGDTGAAFQAWALKDDGSQLQPAIVTGIRDLSPGR